MKKIGIVILHFRSVSITKDCLDSLCSVKLPRDTQVQIVVVDNASEDQFPKSTPRCSLGEVVVLTNTKNLGFTGGMNTGIRFLLDAGADYVIILNNDTLLDRDLLVRLIEQADSDPKVGAVVPKIYFHKGTEFHKDRYKEKDLGRVIWYAGGETDWSNVFGFHVGVDEVDTGQFAVAHEVGFATGCCLLLKREILERVGLLDDKYFLYYEDNDMSQRIKHAGFRIMFEPKAIVWHKNAKSAGGAGSVLQDYYISRNRLLFGMRYAPLRSKIALIRESFRQLFSGRPWQKRGIFDFYLQRFGRGSYKI